MLPRCCRQVTRCGVKLRWAKGCSTRANTDGSISARNVNWARCRSDGDLVAWQPVWPYRSLPWRWHSLLAVGRAGQSVSRSHDATGPLIRPAFRQIRTIEVIYGSYGALCQIVNADVRFNRCDHGPPVGNLMALRRALTIWSRSLHHNMWQTNDREMAGQTTVERAGSRTEPVDHDGVQSAGRLFGR